MFIDLDTIDWASLEHAHGEASERVRQALAESKARLTNG